MGVNEPREPGAGDLASQASRASGDAATPPEVERLAQDTTEPTPELAAVSDRQTALRALRNLEATEARLERNARREIEDARGKLVQQLLPVLDNLDRTIQAAHAGRSGRGDPAMLEGVGMVRQQLEGVLRGYGVERVEALGQRFDPAVHDAISMVSVGDPQRHGVVVHQAEPGYRFAGRLLRPAKVSVGKLVAPFELGPTPMWR
jgi:molecular chaperone GrpE (heat shock protein)